jgi:lipopolysaccharide assembly outer membrane protein LptD (OstA)
VSLLTEKDDVLNGTAFLNSDFLYLSRSEYNVCKDLGRLSNKIGWKKKNEHRSGVVLDVSTAMRFDSYIANCCSEQGRKYKITKTYPVHENGLSCSYPLYSEIGQNYTTIWGPKVSISSIRTSRSRLNVPVNEDSLFTNYDDLNLFQINRSTGCDQIENGERATYGFENSIYTNSGRRLIDCFIGKSNMLNNKKEKSNGVGHLIWHPTECFSIRTRFVGLPFLESIKMFEMGSNFQFKRVNFDCAYFGENRTNKLRNFGLSQLGCSVGYQLSQYWSISSSQVFNLKRKAGHRNLSHGFFAKYKDECFEFGIGIYKSHCKDMDLKRKTGIILAFAFRNLCEISQSYKKYKYHSIINNIE